MRVMLDERSFENFVKTRVKGRRVLVQLPEGLKPKIDRIAKILEQSGYEVVISMEPCYGACDIRDEEAKRLGCDLVLHLGHKELVGKREVPMLVVYYPISIDVEIDVKKVAERIREEKIGLVTTVQHEHLLAVWAKQIEEVGKKAIICGPILGCDQRNALVHEKEVDCFLFVGSGRFHALGIRTKKPIYLYDVEKNELTNLDEDRRRWELIDFARKEAFRDAKRIGFLVSWKRWQVPAMEELFALKKETERRGKEVLILAFDEIKNEKLLGMKLDLLVNFACPRIKEDKFDVPIINKGDLEAILVKEG